MQLQLREHGQPGLCHTRHTQESEVKPGSVKSPLVGAGGDRVEHIGQETVGNATREGANVGIAFDAAKVRRPLLSVDSLEEKGQVAVFTDSSGFIIPKSALQVDPAMRKLRGEELTVERRSSRVVRKPCESAPEERSAHEGTHLPFRDWCPHCVSCQRFTEKAEGEPPMVQIDYQFALEKTNVDISAEQVVTAGPMVIISMATICGRGAVAAAQ